MLLRRRCAGVARTPVRARTLSDLSAPDPVNAGTIEYRHPSDRSADRKGCCGQGLRLLAPETARLAACLDRGLLDLGHGAFELVEIFGAYSNQAGCAENAVAGGEVGLLLKDVVVLR